MSRFRRFKYPPWARKCIFLIESAIIPIIIFQLIRTIFFVTTFDVIVLAILIGVLLCFYLDWI